MTSSRNLLISSITCLQLKFSFIWPLQSEEQKPHPRWFYIRLAILQIISVVILYIPVCIHINKLFERDLDASEDFALIFAYYGFISTMIFYSISQKKIVSLIDDLSDFSEFGKPPNFNELNQKLDFWSKIWTLYTVGGIIFYNGTKIYEMPKCKADRGPIQVCGLLIPLWTPWTVDTFFLYILHLIVTFFYTVVFTRATLFYSIQVLEIAMNIKLRIDHLNLYIVRCFDDPKSSRRSLIKCIHYHQKIIDNFEKLNEAFYWTAFCHIVASVLACACVAHQVVTQDMMAGLHYFGWIVSIYVICWAGQILTESSVTVSDACFNSNWLKASPSLRRDLLFIMRRSQKSFKLKAGPFHTLCFTLFIAVNKLSYSVLTLID